MGRWIRLPELSNFCCLPGRAGGTPILVQLLGTHTAFDVIPQNPSLINYSALGIPAGTKEFTIGFYAGSNGSLVPSVTYAGGSTNRSVQSQGMADYNKTEFKDAYPFTGLTPDAEDEAARASCVP